MSRFSWPGIFVFLAKFRYSSEVCVRQKLHTRQPIYPYICSHENRSDNNRRYCGFHKMTAEERATMLRMLQSLPVLLSPLGKTDIEIFRGDSFQVKVAEPSKALHMARFLESNATSNSPHPMRPQSQSMTIRYIIPISYLAGLSTLSMRPNVLPL